MSEQTVTAREPTAADVAALDLQIKQLQEQRTATAAAVKPKPRPPQDIMISFAHEVASLLGYPMRLVSLLEELAQVLYPPPPPPAA